MTRRPLVTVAALAALSAPLAACGASQTAVSKPNPHLARVDQFCESALRNVRNVPNFDAIGALNDGALLRTARALHRVAADLRSGSAGERRVAAAATEAAAAIERYVRGNVQDNANATTTFHDMYAGLVNLNQIASTTGVPACGLNTMA